MSQKLLDKLSRVSIRGQMTPRQLLIYDYIANNPGISSGQIADQLGLVLVTTKVMLRELVARDYIKRHGVGRGVTYTL